MSTLVVRLLEIKVPHTSYHHLSGSFSAVFSPKFGGCEKLCPIITRVELYSSTYSYFFASTSNIVLRVEIQSTTTIATPL